MDDDESPTRRSGIYLLIGALAALGLTVAPALDMAALQAPANQTPASPATPTTEAARTAKKVKKAAGKAPAAGAEREALRHFQKEVAEYDELHREQLGKVGTRDPKALQTVLAHAIAAKRDKARQGDVLGSKVEPIFRRLVAEQLKGPDANSARKAVREGNPEVEKVNTAPVDVRVNAIYPDGAPLSTVPPSVLLTLPELPKSLNYRFVGRDLLLVDSVAQLIVDFLPNAAPELVVR
jgi:hypothetical protein